MHHKKTFKSQNVNKNMDITAKIIRRNFLKSSNVRSFPFGESVCL